MEDNHKSGFVGIIGNPNVGKSTLINALIGQRVSIVTHKAQTTRHRILGILNNKDYQIIFSDTPGIIKPKYKLQKSMMDFAKSTFEDSDIFLYIVEPGKYQLKDENILSKIKESTIPIFVVINKIDTKDQEFIKKEIEYYKENFPNAKEIIPISALNNFNLESLLFNIIDILPKSPAYYDKEDFTDKPEKFFVNEILREKILLNYDKEIPYCVEIITDIFSEKDNVIIIKSNIIVERESQKAIILGHRGEAIKRICIQSRLELEKFFNKKIYLETFVKVNKDWRNDEKRLREYQYKN